MKPRSLILIIASVCFAHSCIDPVDFSKGDDSESLVVDGLITTEPGPYVVYLSRTTDYNSFYSSVERVKDAIVMISDDLGNVELLTETYLHGIYETDPDGIRGVPGRYYTLEIETPDGKHYESAPELLSPVPEIDTIYYKRQILQELDDRSMMRNYDGFQIYIDFSDPENEINYYMWSWTGTHEVHTQPWSYFNIRKRRPAPKDCCATCWVTESNGDISVFADGFSEGSRISAKPVAFVRIINSNQSRHFRGKYHMELQQLSLTEEAYKYWSVIETQISSSGSIFEPPPVAISGNITNCDDPEDVVFGYFGASAIRTKGIFIPASETTYPVGDTLVWPDDCRTLSNSTAIMPAFW
jgi:hypothetical protein